MERRRKRNMRTTLRSSASRVARGWLVTPWKAAEVETNSTRVSSGPRPAFPEYTSPGDGSHPLKTPDPPCSGSGFFTANLGHWPAAGPPAWVRGHRISPGYYSHLFAKY